MPWASKLALYYCSANNVDDIGAIALEARSAAKTTNAETHISSIIALADYYSIAQSSRVVRGGVALRSRTLRGLIAPCATYENFGLRIGKQIELSHVHSPKEIERKGLSPANL
jgi:hypothetical protein